MAIAIHEGVKKHPPHVQVLIDAIIAKPDTSIWELVFMTPEELQLVHKFTVIPAQAVPAHISSDGLRPVIFDRHGHMLPPGIPGELVLLPYDPVAHEQEYGEHACLLAVLLHASTLQIDMHMGHLKYA